MLSFYLVGIFSIILSLLVSVLFYINKNIKTFIDIENNNIKSYLQLFGVLHFKVTFMSCLCKLRFKQVLPNFRF